MALNDCTLVFDASINPKQGMQYTYTMVLGWSSPILGQSMAKEYMRVLELFFNMN
jgi:hypothetical protein